MSTTDPFTTEPQPRKTRRWPAILATGVGALIVGTVIGSAGATDSAEAGPTSTATVTATATTTATAEPEVKTVSEEVEVEVTPQSCLDYIDTSTEALGMAGETISDLSEGMGIASEVMGNPYSAEQNIDTLMGLTESIEARNVEFDPLAARMVELAMDCRS